MKNFLNESVVGWREDRVRRVSEAASLSTRSAQLRSVCFSPCEELSEEQKGWGLEGHKCENSVPYLSMQSCDVETNFGIRCAFTECDYDYD